MIIPGTISNGLLNGQAVLGNIGIGIGASIQSGYVQYLEGGTNDGLNLLDNVGTLTQPQVTNRKVLTFDGTGDYLTLPISGVFNIGDYIEINTSDIVQTALNTILFSTRTTTTSSTGHWISLRCPGISVGVNKYSIEAYSGGVGGTASYASTGSLLDAHTLKIIRTVSGFDLFEDGILLGSYNGAGSFDVFNGQNNVMLSAFSTVSPAGFCNFKVNSFQIFQNSIATALIHMEESAGNICYDISGNENDGTITSTDIISAWANTASGIPSYQALDGFDLYTHATLDSIYVPHKPDGTSLSITPPTGYSLDSVHPGGYVHNGGSYSVIATDTSLNTNLFWSDGAGTLVAKTYADFLAHFSFEYGALLQFKHVNGNCLVNQLLQYPDGVEWTPTMYENTALWVDRHSSTCGAGHLVPLTIDGGGIGPPGGTYFTYDGTHILLVKGI